MSVENEGSKKQKVDSPEWKLVFDQTQSLRTLMDVISNLLTRVQVQICKTPSFQGIQIESIDAKRVCLVVAKLACKVETSGSEEAICLETSVITTCLKSIGPHYSVDLQPAGNRIMMRCYEMISNSYATKFMIPTIVMDSDNVKLTDMKYEYTIEIDLLTLRSIVKNCIALRGEYITLRVQEPKTVTKKRHTTLSIVAEGNAEQEHCFHSVTEVEGDAEEGSCVIRTMNDSSSDTGSTAAMETRYSETFSANYLNLFMKSMERQMITMKLSPNQPLILTYPLGVENSSICFVLAPRAKEDD